MAPNNDYEYGVDFDRKSSNAASGIRYIGRSEMVEFVCHGEESKRKSSASKSRVKSAKSEAKFARVKSPKMRRHSDQNEGIRNEAVAPVKPRKRCVTFNLDDRELYPTIDTCLPPIEPAKASSTPEIVRKRSAKQQKQLRKTRSMDDVAMSKLVPLESPAGSPLSSPRLAKRGPAPRLGNAALNRKSTESITVDRFSSAAEFSPKKRFERVDSMLKKLEMMSNRESVRIDVTVKQQQQQQQRTPPASPRSSTTARSSKAQRNLFIDLDHIEDYKPDRNRMKFIQAALSSSTSAPRFIRPGSGVSRSSSISSVSSSASSRSSPVSIAQISIDGDSKARSTCSFPELDAESCATGSRCSSPSLMTSLKRSPRGSSRSSIQEAIASRMATGNSKWYD